MTRKQAQVIAKQHYMRIRWNRDWQEYTVTFRYPQPDGSFTSSPSVYHTTDLDDAVTTAVRMSGN